jgi:hypothetical protein
VPETADTATILIRFCVATESIDAAEDGNEVTFDFLCCFCRHCLPEIAGQAAMRPDPDAPCRDLSPICSHHCMLADEKA